MVVAFGIEIVGAPPLGSAGGANHARVEWGVVPHLRLPSLPDVRTGDDWRLEYDRDRFWVTVSRGASFLLELPVDLPARVDVRLHGWSAEKASIFFLMGLLPLALPRFRLAALHAAAFSVDGRNACLVMGESGAGKTTSLAAALRRGASLLGDDAAAVDEAGMVWPGPPCWASRDADGAYPEDYLGKAVHVETTMLRAPVPISSVVVLEPTPGAEMALHETAGRDALLAVLRHQRSPWLFTSRGEEDLRLAATATVAQAQVARLPYDPDRHSVQLVTDAVVDWAGARAGAAEIERAHARVH